MAENNNGADVLYVEDMARKLSRSVPAVRMLLYRGELPKPFRIGRRLAWRPEDVDHWLATSASNALGASQPVTSGDTQGGAQ